MMSSNGELVFQAHYKTGFHMGGVADIQVCLKWMTQGVDAFFHTLNEHQSSFKNGVDI